MTKETVSSLPSRPLERLELMSMEDASEYCVRPASEEVYVIALIGENQVHGLGYDDEVDGWVQFESVPMEYSEEAADEFEESIDEWVESMYATELEAGDLVMVGGEGVSEESDEEGVPWEVEQGLEPEYDCPDCEYYKTGVTTSPHAFLDHLQAEHGYSESEASEILH